MDGSYLTRKYRVPLSQSELDTPGTPAARLDALLNAPGLAGESYFHAQREGDRLVDAWLTNPDTDSAIVPASALTGLEEMCIRDREPTAVRQQLTTYTSFIAVNLQIVISFSPHTEKYPSGLIIPLRF